jgi:hypothetical protein
MFASVAVGTTVSIVSGGVMTLVTVIVIDRLAPFVRQYRTPV